MPPSLRTHTLPVQAFVEHYGIAPEVVVSGDASLTIPYIPAHLDYMLCVLWSCCTCCGRAASLGPAAHPSASQPSATPPGCYELLKNASLA